MFWSEELEMQRKDLELAKTKAEETREADINIKNITEKLKQSHQTEIEVF